MSSSWSNDDATKKGGVGGSSQNPPTTDNRAYDDAEKGIYDNSSTLPVISSPPQAHMRSYASTSSDEKKPEILQIETAASISSPPTSPIHEGLTPFSSVQALSLSWPSGWKPHRFSRNVTSTDDGKSGTGSGAQDTNAKGSTPGGSSKDSGAAKKSGGDKKKKQKVRHPSANRWVLFNLWFNTYRKFFTFVTTLNLTGVILAACGKFPYAENHMGALVLGNLLMAVLMRNELFLRLLYIIAIYGLKSVRAFLAFLCIIYPPYHRYQPYLSFPPTSTIPHTDPRPYTPHKTFRLLRFVPFPPQMAQHYLAMLSPASALRNPEVPFQTWKNENPDAQTGF